jgi:hypothetical protein
LRNEGAEKTGTAMKKKEKKRRAKGGRRVKE